MVDVPNVPGVPPLVSYGSNAIALLIADAVSIFNFLLGPQWGIFLDGSQAFEYNSVVDFDYKQDSPTSDYPVEGGSFQNYDKVQLPFDVKVRVSSGPAEGDRAALIQAVRSVPNDLNLYDVITPEMTFSSCNCTHADFKRTNVNGVGLILADFWFIEIRQTATSTFSNTQTPAVAGPQNAGNVAPVDASATFTQRWPGSS